MDKTIEAVEGFIIPLVARPSKDSANKEVQLMINDIDLRNPLHEGHVFKCKSDNSSMHPLLAFFNSFNRRYFVLFPGVILYYEHKREYHEDLKYGLTQYKVLKLNGLYLTHVHHRDRPQNARFCINLHLPDPFNKRQEMLLAFRTRKQKRVWMACLQHQNPNLVPKKI